MYQSINIYRMKYLKSYNESKSSNDRKDEIKIGVLEACFPISKSTMDDICQTLIDEYGDCVDVYDCVKSFNTKMSGASTTINAIENYIDNWRSSGNVNTELDLPYQNTLDDIWDVYTKDTSIIGTFINMNFDNQVNINDVERELIKISKKIESEVGKSNVKFHFDWNYEDDYNSLRARNVKISSYELFIEFKKVTIPEYLDKNPIYESHNDTVTADDIKKLLEINLEDIEDVEIYEINIEDSWRNKDRIAFDVTIIEDCQTLLGTEFVTKMQDIASVDRTSVQYKADLWDEANCTVSTYNDTILNKIARKYDFEFKYPGPLAETMLSYIPNNDKLMFEVTFVIMIKEPVNVSLYK